MCSLCVLFLLRLCYYSFLPVRLYVHQFCLNWLLLKYTCIKDKVGTAHRAGLYKKCLPSFKYGRSITMCIHPYPSIKCKLIVIVVFFIFIYLILIFSAHCFSHRNDFGESWADSLHLIMLSRVVVRSHTSALSRLV